MEIVGDYEYSKKDLIGHGAFAVVFKGRIRKRHDKTVAIKSITKKNIAKSQNLLTKEIKILKELSDLHHDNVVQLMECKETTNHVYLVMEYCNGGDLADYLQVKGTLSEDTISQFLKQIAGAMRALNAKGIVHRDMKPQNILLCYPPGKKNPPASQINLKIADFGFARFLQDGVMAATLCGSPMYMAPEVIMSIQYDAKADLWSIGTIVFQCLTGKAPFQAQTPQQLKQFYEKNLQLKPNVPSGTSSELKDLLYKLLKRNAKDRIEFEDFFTHPFLRSHSPAASSSPVPVPGRSPSFSSDSPASLKAVSASPLSGKMEYSSPVQTKMRSPHKLDRVEVTAAQGHGSPSEVAGFLKVNKETGTDSRCSTPTEYIRFGQDFVMVPDGMSSDQSSGTEDRAIKMSLDDGHAPESLNTITVTPDVGEALYHKDSSNVNRPSSLQVASPDKSPPPSAPIPVPSQKAAHSRMQTNSPNSPMMNVKPADAINRQKNKEMKKNDSGLVRRSSENNVNAPNIGSLSPPVQFSIGTPPSSSGQAWRRSSVSNSPGRHSNTPPSPLKKSGSVPAHLSPVQYTGPNSLATIIDSPVKAPAHLHYPNLNETKGAISNASYQRHHPYTVPENIQTLEYNGNVPTTTVHTLYNQSDTDLRTGQQGGTSLLSQQLFTAAFGESPNRDVGRTVIPFAGGSAGRIRKSSSSSEKSGSLERDRSSGCLHQGASAEASPPSLMYAQSPSNMEGPITFVAPELAEETIMDDAHNAIMAKLNFVLDLVECIMDVARVRGAPLNAFTESFNYNKEGLPDNIPKFTEAQRRLEQLILHVRSLHLLSSALQLARDEIKTGKLTVSNSLKTVVRQMNEHYHTCVSVSRQLQQRLGSSVQTALSPQIVIATADKLIYNYAIEMCQTAALDELFGNPQECFRRYQMAQILLHSLAQQSRNTRDKESLNKYKEAVERRLVNLQGQNLYHQQVSS